MVAKKNPESLKDNLTKLRLSRPVPRGTNTEPEREQRFKIICDFYKFEKPWKLDSKNGDWKGLCEKLLFDFIPAFHENAAGAHKKISDVEKKKIACEYWRLLNTHRKAERVGKPGQQWTIKGFRTRPVKGDEQSENIDLCEVLAQRHGRLRKEIKNIVDQVSKQLRSDPQYRKFLKVWKSKGDFTIFPDWRLYQAFAMTPQDIGKNKLLEDEVKKREAQRQ